MAGLFGRKLQDEILRKARPVALYSLVESTKLNAVKGSQVRIKDYAEATSLVNPEFRDCGKGKGRRCFLGHRVAPKFEVTFCDLKGGWNLEVAVCGLKI